MTQRFTDRVMVVTGAAQGIGWRVSEMAAREGARLALVDYADYVHERAHELQQQGVKALAIQADLETWEGTEQAMQQVASEYGGFDILVNNVGGTIWAKPYEYYRPEEIHKEVQRSLFPTLWGCRAALPYFLERGGGVIVNVSSVATRGLMRVPYAAAKGGVNAMTVSLAFEYAEHNIRVNATAPGGTEAPPRLTPRNTEAAGEKEQAWYQAVVDQTRRTSFMNRYGTLDEMVAPILFLASDDASYITGSVLPVAGGDPG